MNFGEILDRWERGRRKGERAYGGLERETEERPPGSRAQRLKALKPQAELDLHGLTSLEAEEAIDRFIREAKARGLEKVLIIHGKGNHSLGEPVLRRVVQAFLEKCQLTGAFGTADRSEGGRGATWVLLR